jgi:hypothetical protein
LFLGVAAVAIPPATRAEPPAPTTRQARDAGDAWDARQAREIGEPTAANTVLRRMSDALVAAKALTFDAYSETEQLFPGGRKLEFAENIKMSVRRPNGFTASIFGDLENLRLYYDGRHITLYNPTAKAYATVEAPPGIDATMDVLANQYGIAMPLADLIFSDPYKTLMERVVSSYDVGIGYVFETRCHHLSFSQDALDWQIWVEDGPRALPRKIVITYKQLPAQPRYTAFLSNWNLAPDLPDATFTFTPPEGSKRVEMSVPTTRPAAAAPPREHDAAPSDVAR